MVESIINTELGYNEDDFRCSFLSSGYENPLGRPQKCLATDLETGKQWDECLPKFTEGAININFYNNVISYTSGDCISGTIDIDLQADIVC